MCINTDVMILNRIYHLPMLVHSVMKKVFVLCDMTYDNYKRLHTKKVKMKYYSCS